MSNVHLLENGIVTAQIYGLVTGAVLPSGTKIVPLDQFPEARTGQQLPWPRMKRNALLSASDWTQNPDVVLTSSEKDAAIAYRQALRSLPATELDPATVNWPAPPPFLQSQT